MKLHIFNPEHDIALAANLSNYTAPHVGRQLRSELGFIPALWADDGDFVLVDDVPAAVEHVRHVRKYAADVLFVTLDDLIQFAAFTPDDLTVCPWGWDRSLVRQLKIAGIPDRLLPSDNHIETIRLLSNRSWAAQTLLPFLVQLDYKMVGKAVYYTSFDLLAQAMGNDFNYVLKAPWSSSGRGIRYIHSEENWQRNVTWIKNVIARQEGIMCEPYYNKVKDFGMEFESDGTKVRYVGLSIFKTVNGAYTGSVVATEEAKLEMLTHFVSSDLLERVKEEICNRLSSNFCRVYQGPFGIDMMVVHGQEEDDFMLHPCVELNLRRTMGHVALSFNATDEDPQRLMRIVYDGRYRLKISDTNENVINNSLI